MSCSAQNVVSRPVKPSTETFGQTADGSAEHGQPLVGGEQPVLGLVDPDRDDDLVEERGGSLDDVEVPVGDRVEGPGTDGAAHGASSGFRRDRLGPAGTGHGWAA